MRVLVVEDELKMASLIRRGLVEEGHATDVTPSGEDAVWMAEAHPYDVVVLDVMLPGLSGFEACRRLRKAGVWTPVLMLTARDAVDDRVAGSSTRSPTASCAGRSTPPRRASARSRARSSANENGLVR